MTARDTKQAAKHREGRYRIASHPPRQPVDPTVQPGDIIHKNQGHVGGRHSRREGIAPGWLPSSSPCKVACCPCIGRSRTCKKGTIQRDEIPVATFLRRAAEIVVAKPLQSGMTRTQGIRGTLITGDRGVNARTPMKSPWVDIRGSGDHGKA